MELGIYCPMTLSNPEMLVKSENEADCLFPGEGRSQSPTGTPTSSYGVPGEIIT